MSFRTSIFIVCHDEASYNHFCSNNKDLADKVVFIMVGNSGFEPKSFYAAKDLWHEIEENKSMLTYTAWYALAKNNIVNTEYVGIFEYDTILKPEILSLSDGQLKDDHSVIGFAPRPTNDKLYLDAVPGLTQTIPSIYTVNAYIGSSVWAASTNLIMPKWFLTDFVNWYDGYWRETLQYPNHPHFHERAVNVYAATIGMQYKFFPEWVKHEEKRSHGIEL